MCKSQSTRTRAGPGRQGWMEMGRMEGDKSVRVWEQQRGWVILPLRNQPSLPPAHFGEPVSFIPLPAPQNPCSPPRAGESLDPKAMGQEGQEDQQGQVAGALGSTPSTSTHSAGPSERLAESSIPAGDANVPCYFCLSWMVVCIHLHTLGELSWDHANEPKGLGASRGALRAPNLATGCAGPGLPLGVPPSI